MEKVLRIAAGEIDGAEGAAVSGQRNATDNLHTLLAEIADDFWVKAIDFRAARNEDLAASNGLAGWGTFERGREFLFCFGDLHRHVERVDLEKAGGRVKKREAGVIVRDNGPERRNDAAKKGFDIASADEEIVDFEQDLQAIALKSKLFLVSLSGLKVESIVDGDSNLRGNALHEFDFGIAHAMRNVAAKTDGAESMLRGGERNTGEGMDTFGLQAPHELGVARFLGSVQGDEGKLIFPDPAGGSVVDGSFAGGFRFAGPVVSFKDVQAHGVRGGIV